MCKFGSSDDSTPRAVFLYVVVSCSCRPAGDARHHGRYGSEGQFVAGSGMCTAGFPGYVTHRTVFLPCLQARDARHHGQYGPEGQFYAGLSVAIPQVQLSDEVVVPVVCNDICPGPAACSGACWAVGDDFRLVSVFCVALDSTADTCGASVYKAFWKNFSHFYLKRWIADPEVDSRLSVLSVFSAMLGSTVAGGESFSPDDAYDSALNSVKPMRGKYTINYFQYQGVR